MFEELFHKNEPHATTAHAKILKAHSRVIERNKFEQSMFELQEAVSKCNEEETYRIIKELVPELTQPRHHLMPMTNKRQEMLV